MQRTSWNFISYIGQIAIRSIRQRLRSEGSITVNNFSNIFHFHKFQCTPIIPHSNIPHSIDLTSKQNLWTPNEPAFWSSSSLRPGTWKNSTVKKHPTTKMTISALLRDKSGWARTSVTMVTICHNGSSSAHPFRINTKNVVELAFKFCWVWFKSWDSDPPRCGLRLRCKATRPPYVLDLAVPEFLKMQHKWNMMNLDHLIQLGAWPIPIGHSETWWESSVFLQLVTWCNLQVFCHLLLCIASWCKTKKPHGIFDFYPVCQST